MASYDNLVLVGVQSPSKIKPPADCRGAQMYRVMQSMTRTSQQVRQGVLEDSDGNLIEVGTPVI